MSTVNEIENAIKSLTLQELAEFRQWYIAVDSDSWDQQIAIDSETGKLDFLLEEALEDTREGRTKVL